MTTYQIGDRVISKHFDEHPDYQLHGIYVGNDLVITYPTLPNEEYRAYQTVLLPIAKFASGAVSLCLHSEPTPPTDYIINRAFSTILQDKHFFESSEDFVDWCFKISYPQDSPVPVAAKSKETFSRATSTNDVIDVALQTASLAIPFVNKKYGVALGIGIGLASIINEAARE